MRPGKNISAVASAAASGMIGLVLTLGAVYGKNPDGLFKVSKQSEIKTLEANGVKLVFIDTRSVASCLSSGFAGTWCMPPDHFLYPDGRLAGFRDINWLVGTYGLMEDSVAIVFGDVEEDVQFVAGALYLSGVSSVRLWKGATSGIGELTGSGSNVTRGLLRLNYFANPVRDQYIALDSELRSFFGQGSDLSKSSAGTGSGQVFQVVGDGSETGRRLVVAETPRQALITFVQSLLLTSPDGLRVHIDGLQGRSLEDMGYHAIPGWRDYFTRVLLFSFALLIAWGGFRLWSMFYSRTRI